MGAAHPAHLHPGLLRERATAEIVQIASEDRRLAKAHVSVHMGGVEAAVAHYQQNPTPNLIIIESSLPREQILAELDRLAENCDPGTKVRRHRPRQRRRCSIASC